MCTGYVFCGTLVCFLVLMFTILCVGVHFCQVAEPLLPYALSFAAGAMVFVVVDDIIPEAQSW